MKKLYTFTLLLFALAIQAQTFDFSISFIGLNTGTDNYQMALVATPSEPVSNGITNDMAAGFYLPSGLTIGNFVTGNSAIPATEWAPSALGSNANGDGILISRSESGGNSTVLNGSGPFELVLFDVIASPNPSSGSITFLENGDQLFIDNFIENYIEMIYGGAPFSAYNQNDPAASSIDFSTLSINNPSFNTLEVSVYPNPTPDVLNLATTNKTVSYSIFNILGQSVKLNGVVENNSRKSISLNHLPDGIYILKVEDEDNINKKSFKIIKKK